MRKILLVLLVCPMLSWAGAHDYYECIEAGGVVVASVEPCPKGQKQRRVKDDASPVTVQFEKGAGGTVRLESGRWGNFFTPVVINGVRLRAMVDTGASFVAMSPTAAIRTGVDRRVLGWGWSQTANGLVRVRRVVVDSVEVGGNVFRAVGGEITAKDMGSDFDVALGMSFLKYFEVVSGGGLMVLRPK